MADEFLTDIEIIGRQAREDLVAERIAIQSYQEIARWLGDDDPTSRTMIDRIPAVEEEPADDLLGLLDGFQ